MEETRDAILDHGYTVQWADKREASFGNLPRAHTVGRTLFGRPEILIIGPFTLEQARHMLDELVHYDQTTPLSAGDILDDVAGRRWRMDDAHPSALIGAMATFGTVNALQAVWARPDGTFPGEPQVLRPPDFTPFHPTTDPYGVDDPDHEEPE